MQRRRVIGYSPAVQDYGFFAAVKLRAGRQEAPAAIRDVEDEVAGLDLGDHVLQQDALVVSIVIRVPPDCGAW